MKVQREFLENSSLLNLDIIKKWKIAEIDSLGEKIHINSCLPCKFIP